MAFRLAALLGLLLGLAVPALAQDLSPADRTAIRDIIQSQVEAFRRDDGDAAFGYASPSIRDMFGSSEIFMDMVRQGYQPVYRPRVFDFGEIVTLHGQVTQKVHVVGPDGRPVTAFYPMTQLPDGTWRIDGCYLAGAGRTPGLIHASANSVKMNRVSPKVLALLGALTLVWGTNWPLFKIALDELPVLTFRAVVLVERRSSRCW